MRGKIVWTSNTRGFAFIQPDNGSQNIFVPFSSVISRQDLKLNDIVEFKVCPSPRRDGRVIAVNVKVLGLYDSVAQPQTFDGRVGE